MRPPCSSQSPTRAPWAPLWSHWQQLPGRSGRPTRPASRRAFHSNDPPGGPHMSILSLSNQEFLLGDWTFRRHSFQFSCSVVSDSLRSPEYAACQASLSINNSRSSLKLVSIESVMPFSREKPRGSHLLAR